MARGESCFFAISASVVEASTGRTSRGLRLPARTKQSTLMGFFTKPKAAGSSMLTPPVSSSLPDMVQPPSSAAAQPTSSPASSQLKTPTSVAGSSPALPLGSKAAQRTKTVPIEASRQLDGTPLKKGKAVPATDIDTDGEELSPAPQATERPSRSSPLTDVTPTSRKGQAKEEDHEEVPPESETSPTVLVSVELARKAIVACQPR